MSLHSWTELDPSECSVVIKIEPEDEPPFEMVHEVKIKRFKSEPDELLYADYEINEEIVKGPTECFQPMTASSISNDMERCARKEVNKKRRPRSRKKKNRSGSAKRKMRMEKQKLLESKEIMSLHSTADPESAKVPVLIKTEAEDEPPFEMFHEVNIKHIKSEPEELLYANHEIKEEMVIGPTEFFQPMTTVDHQYSEKFNGHNPKDLNQPCVRKTKLKISKVHGSKPFSCDICFKIFTRKDHLKSHQLLHSTKKLFKCKICYKNFTHKILLTRHFLTHSKVKEYSCDICEKTFVYEDSLLRPKLLHESDENVFATMRIPKSSTGRKHFSCDTCKNIFFRKYDLKRHLLKKHRTENSNLDNETDLKNLVNISSGLDSFNCDTCKKIFNRKDHFKRHRCLHSKNKLEVLVRSKEGGTKQFPCNICLKPFKNKGNLKSHLIVHSDLKRFACEICKKSFSTKNTLNTHILSHSGRKFACKICNKTFSFQSNLRRHLLFSCPGTVNPPIHSRANPCGVGFVTGKSSTEALGIHSQVQPNVPEYLQVRQFVCDICEKTYKRKDDLKIHIQKVHIEKKQTGEKTFKCKICEKSYVNNNNLKRHLLVHSEVKPDRLSRGTTVCPDIEKPKPFQCNVCKKRFAHKNTLSEHIYIHSEVKEFGCEICNDRFSQRRGLMKHLLRHHRPKVYTPKVYKKKKKQLLCDICMKGFACKYSLLTHQKRIHRGYKGDIGVTQGNKAQSHTVSLSIQNEA